MKQIVVKSKKFGDQFTFVSDQHYEQLSKYKWFLLTGDYPKFYAATSLRDSNNKRFQVKMHRFILNASKNEIVDHIDSNGLNNTIENLRICNNSQNAFNRIKAKNNTTGFKGVYFCKKTNKYRASIMRESIRYYLGEYRLIKDAVIAYNNAALKYHGQYAKLNVI